MPEIRHETVPGAGGVSLHCAVAGEAGAPLMLMLHGFPEFWGCWRNVMTHFAACGWLAVAPDMRGCNLSGKPAAIEDYKAKHLVGDVLALGAHYAKGKFVLVGHDWGGAVAWAAAIAKGAQLEKLVMINSPHPYLFWRELTRNPAQQKASEYMNLFRLPKAERVLSENGYQRLLGAFGHLPESWQKELVAAWERPGGLTGGLNYYRASPMHPDAPDDPGAGALKLEAKDFMVRMPTLVLWGERDSALLTGCIDGIEQFVPDLRLVRVPDASHWIIHERPALVCSEMESFLKR
jgi:pimeloyl-ACP methyl ester carboxylesterase